MKIGIYGGSFDPPHLGHKHLADCFTEFEQLDKCLIIPAAIPPHKSANKASSEHRFNMCRLAFPESIYQVSDIELRRTGKSYTFDTLCEIKRLYPNSELVLAMGTDMLTCFTSWYRYREIFSLCNIFAFARDDGEIRMREYIDRELPEFADKITVKSVNPIVLSSTVIREKLKNGEPTDGLLLPVVRDYAIVNELYR